MVSPSDETYFPSLQDCLQGTKAILSWRQAAEALSDASADRLTSAAVSAFLQDPLVLNFFKNPQQPFEPPTARSKADLDSKTAAINVAPTPNDKYDIKVIKEDAQWLSKIAKVNEVAALRIVVVEFQTRSSRHLAGPFSNQDVTILREALGGNEIQASGLIAAALPSKAVPDAEALWTDFQTEASRRRRLVETYLSERRHFVAAADQLLTFLLHSQPTRSGPAVDLLRKSVLREGFGFNVETDFNISAFEALVPRYIRILAPCLESCESGLASDDLVIVTHDFEIDWMGSFLTEMIHAMTLIFQVVDLGNAIFANPDAVVQWFRTMRQCAFLDGLNAVPDSISDLVLPARSLVSIISIALLNVRRSLAYLDHDVELHDYETPYLRSSTDLEEMHETLLEAAESFSLAASPVYFCWSLILHHMHIAYQERAERRDVAQNQRAQDGFELGQSAAQQSSPHLTSSLTRRSSAGSVISIEQLSYDGFLTSAPQERDLQTAERLARTATAGGLVFDWMAEMAICMGDGQDAAFRRILSTRMRLVLLEVLKTSFPLVGYLPESVSALLAVLSGGRPFWDLVENASVLPSQDLVSVIRNDDDLRHQYILQALHRFPYEFMPFASLARILSTSSVVEQPDWLLELLLKTPTLTFVLPSSYNSYELAQEDENTNTIRILEDIPLFAASTMRRRVSLDEQFVIPRDTYGRFVTDNGRVVLLDYQHSFLALLGKRLEHSLKPDAYDSLLGLLQPDEVSEAITLLATLVQGAISGSGKGKQAKSEAALSILEETSRSLSGARDIVSVTCDILDEVLSQDLGNADEADLSIMTACLEFLYAVLPVCPGRVWAYMARCELLNTESRAGRLSIILGTLDMIGERYTLLTAVVRLFEKLVDSMVVSAVQRKVGANFTNKQRGATNPWLGTSDKVLARVGLAIAQSTMDIYEFSNTWRFSSEIQRLSVMLHVMRTLETVLSQALSMGSPEATDNLLACLVLPAKHVLKIFLSTDTALQYQPILASFLAAVAFPGATLYPSRSDTVCSTFMATAKLASSLIAAAQYLNQPSAGLLGQLCRMLPALVKAGAEQSDTRMAVYKLLTVIITAANQQISEPPSLLGFLGLPNSRSFVQVVGALDQPFDRVEYEIQAWRFFSAILRSRQQWMANCLLTGKTPRDAVSEKDKSPAIETDSVLSTARRKLVSISTLDSRLALAILDFYATAQNYWPWTVFVGEDTKALWTSLRAYVRDLQKPATTAKTDATLAIFQTRNAAYIAETFAMRLYHLRRTGAESSFAQDISKDLDFFLRNGAAVADYNVSLHVTLARNFAARYSGCTLGDFKRTDLAPQELGSQYFYALDNGEVMLSYDPAWAGLKQNGFRNEMAMANRNLSLVDAEIALLHSWQYLLLELSTHLLPGNQMIAVQMLQVAEQCLSANQEAQGPDDIFADIKQSRADLAVTLLQRLAEQTHLDHASLLTTIVATVYSVDEPFREDSIHYYRTLLRALYIVLRGIAQSSAAERGSGKTPSPGSIVTTTQTVLAVLDRVVASGFRSVVSLVHEVRTPAYAEDIALLTAILQACLSLPGLDESQGQVLNIMAAQDVLAIATSLYSWSDRLNDKDDPVYGELSLLFLLELSSLPVIAEQLAIDGFLGQLTSVGIANYLRRPHISPVSDSPLAVRCYGIWAKAILPLLLNVLTALGPTIAAEVALVLNQFPNLLQSSVDRFDAPGLSRTSARNARQYITLLSVSEIHTLALLARVLAALRQTNTRDIPAVDWDAGTLLESVDFWLSSRKVLREMLLPLGQREAEWKGMPASARRDCESKLEEKVVVQLEAVRDVLGEGLNA